MPAWWLVRRTSVCRMENLVVMRSRAFVEVLVVVS
jgi:hypothetical protein